MDRLARRKSARGAGSLELSPEQSPNWQRVIAAKDANTAIGEMRQRCLDARSTEQVDEALDMLNSHLQEGKMGPLEVRLPARPTLAHRVIVCERASLRAVRRSVFLSLEHEDVSRGQGHADQEGARYARWPFLDLQNEQPQPSDISDVQAYDAVFPR